MLPLPTSRTCAPHYCKRINLFWIVCQVFLLNSESLLPSWDGQVAARSSTLVVVSAEEGASKTLLGVPGYD